MDDPRVMRRAERSAELNGDVNRALFGHALGEVDRVDEIEAFEALHGEVRGAICQLAEVVDVDDMLVADPRSALGFTPKSRHHFRIFGVLPPQYLDRELLVEARVDHSVDQPHAAFAEQSLHAVALIDRLTEQTLGRRRHPRTRFAHLRVVQPSGTI